MSTREIRIALVGDHDPAVIAHQAIPVSLQLAADAHGVDVRAEWVPTEDIDSDERIAHYDALWCVPASPYRSTDGALRAIQFAREHRRPFLGTCGGFQHAILEYARNVLGWSDAEHAENFAVDSELTARRMVVAPLTCSLVEVRGTVHFVSESRLAVAYHSATGRSASVEGYHCRYGLNVEFRDALTAGPLRVAAVDDAGDVRAVELDDHPFFVAMLFQPERAALDGVLPPIVHAFARAAGAQQVSR